MLVHPLIEKFAHTLVNYCVDLQPGDVLAIRATTLAIPLVREIQRAAVRAGGHVLPPRIAFEGEEGALLAEANAEQAGWTNPVDEVEARMATARITIKAPFNTRDTSALRPELFSHARAASAANISLLRDRMASGSLKTCLTLYPTNALAQEAGMGLAEYETFVFGALFLDRDDPIAAWRDLSLKQQKKVDFLDRVNTLRFVAEDTDLTLSVEGRKWQNSDGHRNFPSGEVFTGPVEQSAEGHMRFSFPLIVQGHEIEGAHLWFEQGRIVKATATRGEAFLNAVLDTDAGSRYLGEVAVGNNYGIQRFTKQILLDEKIGGTCHLAFGAAYRETGSRNDSAVHVDMLCDLKHGGAIFADGEAIYRDGRWLVGE